MNLIKKSAFIVIAALALQSCGGGKIEPEETEFSVNCKNEDHYHAVDLGLSVLWSCCNLGADHPEDLGDHYAWGEKNTKDCYDWDNYRFYNPSNKSMTKYVIKATDGFPDRITQIESIDDAANSIYGGMWRIPSRKEWLELLNSCDWTWVDEPGRRGYEVRSRTKKTGIFIPMGGYSYDDKTELQNEVGYYWSSSVDENSSFKAACVGLSESKKDIYLNYRFYGFSIRPVRYR